MITIEPNTTTVVSIEADNSDEKSLLSDDYIEKLRTLVRNRWDDIWSAVRERHQGSAPE